MAKESAKQFLELMEKDAELQKILQGSEPEQAVSLAKEKGLDFTVDELLEAVKDIREERSAGAKELNEDDLDQVAGGIAIFQNEEDMAFGDRDVDCNKLTIRWIVG